MNKRRVVGIIAIISLCLAVLFDCSASSPIIKRDLIIAPFGPFGGNQPGQGGLLERISDFMDGLL